tara:strand:- start:153 stop:434 length:282 start_codon:yes stop_codon:yes gene_type:complete
MQLQGAVKVIKYYHLQDQEVPVDPAEEQAVIHLQLQNQEDQEMLEVTHHLKDNRVVQVKLTLQLLQIVVLVVDAAVLVQEEILLLVLMLVERD